MRPILLLTCLLLPLAATQAQEVFPYPTVAFGGGVEMGRAPGELEPTGAAIFEASIEFPLISGLTGYLDGRRRFGITDWWAMDARAGNLVMNMLFRPLSHEGSVDSRVGLVAFYTTGGSPEESKGVSLRRLYRNSWINRIGPDVSGLEYGLQVDFGSTALYLDRMTEGRRLEVGLLNAVGGMDRTVAWDIGVERTRMSPHTSATGFQWAFKVRARLYPI